MKHGLIQMTSNQTHSVNVPKFGVTHCVEDDGLIRGTQAAARKRVEEKHVWREAVLGEEPIQDPGKLERAREMDEAILEL